MSGIFANRQLKELETERNRLGNRSVLDWPSGVTVHHPDKCYNGYTLVHGRGPWDPVRGISASSVDRWYLIDMKGSVVHEFFGDPATQSGSQLFERVAKAISPARFHR